MARKGQNKPSRQAHPDAPPGPVADARPRDFANVGPLSIDGVEASDLPDHGRGPVETNPGKELRRRLPQQTGAIESTEEVGLRGEPEIADAEEHGHLL